MNPFLMQLTGQAENRFYGHVHLLAKYCGIEGSPWINGYLQHGWNATDGFGNYLGSKRSANKFVWSKRCEDIIKKSGYQNVSTIGAPWIYLSDVYPTLQKQNKTGVIAYPAHSSTWSQMGDTSKEYAKFLKSNYGEVTVALHTYDFANHQIRAIYESMGHKTLTHGIGTPWEKQFAPLFLKNQRDILLNFSIAVSNTMSTPLLYANSLGLKSEIGGPVDYSVTDPDDAASQIGDGLTNWNELLNNNQELWKEELGLDYKKSASELRDIIGWNPKSKKSLSFFTKRAKDLVTGSNRFVAIEVFKSKYKMK
jgi:hypothetical protein